jgi:competence protein ComEC
VIGRFLALPPLLLITAAVGTISAWLLAIFFRRRRLSIAAASLGLILVGAVMMSRALSPPEGENRLVFYAEKPCRVEGEVVGTPRGFEGGCSIKIRTSLVQWNGRIIPVQGRLRLWIYGGDEAKITPGDMVRAEITPRLVRGKRFPGDRDRRIALAGEGVYLTAGVASGPKFRLIPRGPPWWWKPIHAFRFETSSVLSSLDQPEDGILHALLLGRRSRLDPYIREAFRRSGLSHILAVSGLHIGLVGILAFSGTMFLARRLDFLTARRDARSAAALFSILPVVAYTLITGANPPAVRACVMAVVIFLALAVGRSAEHLNSLILAAMVILLLSPPALFSPAFQLSFMAVLFIIKAVDTFPRLFQRRDIRRGKELLFSGAARYLAVSAAAVVGTFPLVGFHFHHLTATGILTSLLAIPLCALVILPFGLAGGVVALFSQTAGRWVMTPAAWGGRMLADIGSSAASLNPLLIEGFQPSPAQVTGLYLLLFAWWFFKRSAGRFLFLAGMAILVLSTLAAWKAEDRDHLRVTFLDVGQGDAALLETPGGNSFLIDAGGRFEGFDRGASVVLPFLKARGIREIQALVISHGHPDHIGGAVSVLEEIECREIWHNGRREGEYFQDLEHIKGRDFWKAVGEGDRIYSAEGAFFFWNPPQGGPPSGRGGIGDANDHSLVFTYRGYGASVAFTGDVSHNVLEDLAERHPFALRADLLKVPHHGSARSSSSTFYREASPELAVIPAGRNPFGHPSPKVLKDLGDAGARVHVTGIDGTLECRFMDDRWLFRSWKGEGRSLSPAGPLHWFIAGY